MNNYLSIGDLHRLENGLPYDEHDAFYEYLLISPSYLLAHQVATGQRNLDARVTQIFEWTSVQNTYALCGNVYDKTFLQWWDIAGRDIFYTQQADGSYIANGLMRLETNKINSLTLIKGYLLVNYKAAGPQVEGEKIPNWKLGVDANLRSKWVDELKGLKKLTHDNLEARTELGILVSRKIKEAFYVAENAARGNFPSSKKIDTSLDFDYEVIMKNGQFLSLLAMKEDSERVKSGQNLYRLSIVKKFFRKKKAAKKLKIAH